ncbi:MAG TPA: chromosomal replication initiator protein DnaA [Ktedonobacteraceae bacterium]|nr:chromosomal replication initiator protein DnaA [Ktedonobacteraceae bacterium]
MNAKQIWQTTIERLQTKVQPAAFTTWFQGTDAISFQDGIFIVRVPTTFAKAHLEGRFLDLIRSILSEVAGGQVEIRFLVSKEAPASRSDGVTEPSSAPHKRTYRIPKSRLASLEHEKSKLDAAFVANNAASTPSTRPVAHRRSDKDAATDEFEAENETRAPRDYVKNALPGLLPLGGEGMLNPRYTFSTFIMGKSNQLAHAASLAVAENPGQVYNPLFFYGGVGLGKTHLLHAIGHVGEASGLNVLYVTSEKFTNEIINAIRYQKTEEFRAKYRQIDILMVDDIQFIAGKESTEEEFFHTFNTLHSANKQIVVTSDRPPKAIHSLQDRLRSRFEWGLLADIQPPEYEHRLAILRSKAESLRFAIPPSVIEYIARPECSSVRELEGALNRVIAYATLHDAALTVNLAVQALEHIYNEGSSRPHSSMSISQVLEGVCAYYNVDLERMRGKQREREIAWPRQVAMYLMRQETSASLIQIGAELGGRDHTTIMHGWEKVQTEIGNNDRVRHEVAAVLESLQRGKSSH